MIDINQIDLDVDDSEVSCFKSLWWTPKYIEVGPLAERVAARAGIEATKELRCVVANLVLAKTLATKHGQKDLSVIISRRAESFVRCYPAALYRVGRVWTPRRRAYIAALDALEEAEVIEQYLGRRRHGATEIVPGWAFDEELLEAAPVFDLAAEGGVVTLKTEKVGGARAITSYDEKRAAGRQQRLDRINQHVEAFTYEYTPSEREGGRGEQAQGGAEASSSASSRACSKASSRVSIEQALRYTPSRSGAPSVQLPKSFVRMNRTYHVDGGAHSEWGHGRFYSVFQGIPSRDRPSLRVDGEPVVELDIAATTPTMLYHLAGLEPPHDPYCPPGLDPEYRDTYKAISNVAFNAKSRGQTMKALLEKLKRGDIRLPPGTTLGDLLDAFRRAHAPIADQFFTGAGLRTMQLDARIAEKVMLSFVGSDVPCLTVHDAFIVPERAEERLYHAIVDAYGSVVASNRRPRLKATYADGSTSYVTAASYGRGAEGADTYRQKGRA